MKRSIIIGILLLCGCAGPRDPGILASNRTILSGPGEDVGTLPDGRKIVRYELDIGYEGVNRRSHWLYVTEDSTTINRTEKVGKADVNRVETFLK